MQFEYLEPETVEVAISLLSQYDGRAKVIAGGTDLLVQIRNKTIEPGYVVDIGGLTDATNETSTNVLALTLH